MCKPTIKEIKEWIAEYYVNTVYISPRENPVYLDKNILGTSPPLFVCEWIKDNWNVYTNTFGKEYYLKPQKKDIPPIFYNEKLFKKFINNIDININNNINI